LIFIRWLPSIAMMGAIFFLSSLPSSRIPDYGSLDFLIKKGGHAIGFGLLGLSYYFALPRRLSRVYRGMTAFLMVVLFALSDEYHQSFVQGRTSSLRDVFIDSLGALGAITLGAIYSSNSKSRSRS
jgi:VanZ family protein